MTSTSDSQWETLRRQRRQVTAILSASLLLFMLVSWRMPDLALAIVAYALVSLTIGGLYVSACVVTRWWIRHH